MEYKMKLMFISDGKIINETDKLYLTLQRFNGGYHFAFNSDIDTLIDYKNISPNVVSSVLRDEIRQVASNFIVCDKLIYKLNLTPKNKTIKVTLLNLITCLETKYKNIQFLLVSGK
jgi:glutathionyl-hydroquinone reductase